MTDRLETWRLFASVAELGSFVAAARRARRSPQAVTRAIAALEERVGARLLHRTTRSVSLTDDGARTLEGARRLLADADELDASLASRGVPRGRLAVTAPVLFGEMHVAPIVNDYLARHREVEVRLELQDRIVSLADEGLDVGVRIGELPDSALRARRVGAVRRITCASPAYLERRGLPRHPRDLTGHDCIGFAGTTPAPERWAYPGHPAVRVGPRLIVNTGRAAIDAAVAGLGVVRVLSYQVEALLARDRLRVILARHEPDPLPVHLVVLPGRQLATRVTAFLELAATRLTGICRW